MGQPDSKRRNAWAPQSRRSFLRRAGFAGSAALSLVGLSACSDDGKSRTRRTPGSSADVFAHGVASGDPLADRVMLWSRVTPAAEGDVSVNWTLSESPDMSDVLRSGTVVTGAARDYTVKVDATGLAAGQTYYYRFEALGETSPIGRTRTLPAAGVDRLRIAVLSCSNYPFGFFNVYARVAARADLDLVLHLGDYIYEYPGRGVSAEENPDEYGDGRPLGRAPEPPYEIVTLEDYRTRHACYKTDPDLQEVHRQHPMIAVWDDHESTNNSWRDGAQNHDPDRGEGACSNYPFGFFNVYARVAARADLDLVLHLGDYIYEYPGRGVSAEENPDEYGDGRPLGRAPEPPYEIVTLEDYRTRHACYKTDPDLQEVHRQHPMIAVWDDHESTNNSWRDGAQNHDPDRGEGAWSEREAVSIQAYYEWLPIREVAADNPERIYRGFDLGDLVSLSMLDTRLIGRDEQLAPNVEQGFTDTGAYADAGRTLIDAAQRDWLSERLNNGNATWHLLGQQVMFGQLKILGAPNASNTDNSGGQGGVFLNPDQWDGYPRAREAIWDIIRGGQAAPNVAIDNVVVLTGDIHTSWAMDITEDPNNPGTYDPDTGMGSMGVEFVTTSVTSPGSDADPAAIMSQNPHMKYVELASRGYLLLDITPARMQAEWWYVDDIESRNDTERFAAAWQVRAGENHVVAADAASTPKGEAPLPAPAASRAVGGR